MKQFNILVHAVYPFSGIYNTASHSKVERKNALAFPTLNAAAFTGSHMQIPSDAQRPRGR